MWTTNSSYVFSEKFSLTKLETHRCVLRTVDTDALVLKHQAISIYSADQFLWENMNMYQQYPRPTRSFEAFEVPRGLEEVMSGRQSEGQQYDGRDEEPGDHDGTHYNVAKTHHRELRKGQGRNFWASIH